VGEAVEREVRVELASRLLPLPLLRHNPSDTFALKFRNVYMPGNKIVAIQSQAGELLGSMSLIWNSLLTDDEKPPHFVVPPKKSSPFIVVRLFGSDASRSENDAFSNTVGDPDVVLITGLSHGGPDEFTGYQNKPLYDGSSDLSVVQSEIQGKVVHLLACSTASPHGLGAMFINAGCAAFIGYSEPVPIDDSSDAGLTTLITCDAQIEYSLLNGSSVALAVQEAKRKYHSSGLDSVGKLLVCNPENCGLSLPGIVTDRVLPMHELPAANTVAVRTM
jgi:hypothetical protein